MYLIEQKAITPGNKSTTTQQESESANTLHRNELAPIQIRRESAIASHRTLSLIAFSTSTAFPI